jgi:hypothetical protein
VLSAQGVVLTVSLRRCVIAARGNGNLMEMGQDVCHVISKTACNARITCASNAEKGYSSTPTRPTPTNNVSSTVRWAPSGTN